jgi:hypothetical protein
VVVGCLLDKGEVATTVGGFLAADGVLEVGEAAVGNLEGAAGIIVGNLDGAAAEIVVEGLLEVGEVAAGGCFVLLTGVAATIGFCLSSGNVEGADGFVVGNSDGAAAVTVVMGLLEVGEVAAGCLFVLLAGVAATIGCCLFVLLAGVAATIGCCLFVLLAGVAATIGCCLYNGSVEGSDGFVVGNFDGAAAVTVAVGLLEVGEVAATTGCCFATNGEVVLGKLEGEAACD